MMVYRLVARDTIEEKVMALKARKARLFSSVLNDGNAFGTAINAGRGDQRDVGMPLAELDEGQRGRVPAGVAPFGRQ